MFHELGADVVAIGCAPDGSNINAGFGATSPGAAAAGPRDRVRTMGWRSTATWTACSSSTPRARLYSDDELFYVMAGDRLARGQAVTGRGRDADDQRRRRTRPGRRARRLPRWCAPGRRPPVPRELLARLAARRRGLRPPARAGTYTPGDGIVSAITDLHRDPASRVHPGRTAGRGQALPAGSDQRPPAAGDAWKTSPAWRPRRTKCAACSAATAGVHRPSGTEPVVRVMVEALRGGFATRCAQRLADRVARAWRRSGPAERGCPANQMHRPSAGTAAQYRVASTPMGGHASRSAGERRGPRGRSPHGTRWSRQHSGAGQHRRSARNGARCHAPATSARPHYLWGTTARARMKMRELRHDHLHAAEQAFDRVLGSRPEVAARGDAAAKRVPPAREAWTVSGATVPGTWRTFWLFARSICESCRSASLRWSVSLGRAGTRARQRRQGSRSPGCIDRRVGRALIRRLTAPEARPRSSAIPPRSSGRPRQAGDPDHGHASQRGRDRSGAGRGPWWRAACDVARIGFATTAPSNGSPWPATSEAGRAGQPAGAHPDGPGGPSCAPAPSIRRRRTQVRPERDAFGASSRLRSSRCAPRDGGQIEGPAAVEASMATELLKLEPGDRSFSPMPGLVAAAHRGAATRWDGSASWSRPWTLTAGVRLTRCCAPDVHRARSRSTELTGHARADHAASGRLLRLVRHGLGRTAIPRVGRRHGWRPLPARCLECSMVLRTGSGLVLRRPHRRRREATHGRVEVEITVAFATAASDRRRQGHQPAGHPDRPARAHRKDIADLAVAPGKAGFMVGLSFAQSR